MKKQLFSSNTLLGMLFLFLIALTAMGFQDPVKTIKQQPKAILDTLPKNKIDIQIDMKGINETIKKSLELAQKSLKDINWDKISKDIEMSLKQIDMAKLQMEINKSLKEIDWKKINQDIEKSMLEMKNTFNSEELKKEMEKIKKELEQHKIELKIEMEKNKEELKKFKKELAVI